MEIFYKHTEEGKAIIQEVARQLEQMETIVGKMQLLYEQNDWLNDEINIEEVVPMSLDEWFFALGGKIEELCELTEPTA